MKEFLLVILKKVIIPLAYVAIAITMLTSLVFATTMLIPTLVACTILIVHGENVLTAFANSDPNDILVMLSPFVIIPIDLVFLWLLNLVKKELNL